MQHTQGAPLEHGAPEQSGVLSWDTHLPHKVILQDWKM